MKSICKLKIRLFFQRLFDDICKTLIREKDRAVCGHGDGTFVHGSTMIL